jgi:hypothetical protein
MYFPDIAIGSIEAEIVADCHLIGPGRKTLGITGDRFTKGRCDPLSTQAFE